MKKYEDTGELARKVRENKRLKVTDEIVDYVKKQIDKSNEYLQHYKRTKLHTQKSP